MKKSKRITIFSIMLNFLLTVTTLVYSENVISDTNNDDKLDIKDAIIALQVSAGLQYDLTSNQIHNSLDAEDGSPINAVFVNSDGVVHISESFNNRPSIISAGSIKVGSSYVCNEENEGVISYNNTKKSIELCNGSKWVDVCNCTEQSFSIASVSFNSSIISGGPAEDISITWKGNPTFPITADYLFREGTDCPGNCLDNQIVFDDYNNPLLFKDAMMCTIEGTSQTIQYDIQLTDANGNKTQLVPVPLQCINL